MTTKADYTDEEWVALRRAPLLAGLAVSLADPGGPIELTKEALAILKWRGRPRAGTSCSWPSRRTWPPSSAPAASRSRISRSEGGRPSIRRWRS